MTEKNLQYHVNESADKITLKTNVKRGSGTRDQDKLTVKVKDDDPEAAAAKLAATLTALEDHGVTATLRNTQPEEDA
jgi:hypothetical protein